MNVKRWRPGDPVAPGAFFIDPHDTETQRAYGEQAQREQINGIARAIVNLPTLAARRRRIDKTPQALRQRVKQRVTELWNQTKN